MIGKVISERYRIIRPIDNGGMSYVYLANDLILQREVAVKILRPELTNNREYVERFNLEGQAASSLSHPNIVSILDVGEEDGLCFLVMEYIRGMTLKEYIRNFAPLTVEQTLNIIEQILAAVAVAHSHNIIHRDIKPQNILINKDGMIKITDFGIATSLSTETLSLNNNVLLGSVQYLSPEQVRGGKADRRTDIYSIGIVMFEMLTGSLPFSGETPVTIALKHIREATPSVKMFNPKIPQSVENVVLRATAKKAINRYESIEDMELDISTVLAPNRLFEAKYVEPNMSYADDQEETKVITAFKKEADMNFDKRSKTSGKTEQIDKNKEQKKGKKKKVIIISVSLVAVFFAVFVYLFLSTSLFRSPDKSVPELSGMRLEQAKLTLKDQEFSVGEVIELEDDAVAEGFVIKSDPPASTKRKKQSKIDLYVSIGKKRIEVENYVNQVYAGELKKLIEAAHYKRIEVVEEQNDTLKAGTIISQNPSPGQRVIASDVVLRLTISKGQIELEDFTGWTSENLNEYESQFGIKFKRTEEAEYNETIEKGRVVSQKPLEGTKVAIGATVNVVISKGKDPAQKTILREYKIPYTALNGGAQVVEVYIKDVNRNTDTKPEDVLNKAPYNSFEINETVQESFSIIVSKSVKGYIWIKVDGRLVHSDILTYE